MYVVDLKTHEKIIIGEGADQVVIRVEKKSGQRARLSFEAGRKVKIQKTIANDKQPA